ncbi:hypothetical protein GRI62_11610 [Erythrobacter arachoides]|uniref:Uncharacterized protein n=1 Tax=Aurantiacibacter arachoides TaxID=1850444 RepID=A0A845A496_9SPHN|nr:hypothetical protein [Aurantiacibacter arachoides]MXO94242.1 hypothetical protein [Aurantiacibacter arachoides]GGD65050.1 hypothetical protein GCM10011411_26670 [Aurantiacibacter arachoides]
MADNERLNRALQWLGAVPDPSLPEDFMGGVWMRAGKLEQVDATRTRVALFTAMAFIGLGAGFGTSQSPARESQTNYQLIEGADLSPASLLHVQP